MGNWMEKYERGKDEQIERNLNTKLEKLLNLLDEAYNDEERAKVLEEIIKVYRKLEFNIFEYNKIDYIDKEKQLAEIRYKIKRQEHIESIESQSWNDYEKEEMMEDDEERE